jgi:epoxyqueuosine reductase
MDDRLALTHFVKHEALRLGFSTAGITTPASPPHLEVYREWIDRGRQGEMAYLSRPSAIERRADPRLVFPECRSILVVAWPYQPPSASPISGRVAAYARGPDYHDVLIERLQALMAAVEVRLGDPFPFRLYTDTGPLLERELAQRAGIGWIGKNTCLLTPGRGSYFLLAEALLSLDLVPDTPFDADRCGSCTRCLEACPTSCILPDRTLDARRCVSYLTIELRGPIPAPLRPAIGDWLFGCDICQQVCPWNVRFAGAPSSPVPEPEAVRLKQILESDDAQLSSATRGTALRRAQRRGLLRNAAVVAANTSAGDTAPALARRLQQDPDPVVRGHAAWALGKLGARQALLGALPGEGDAAVREEINQALADQT